MKALLFLLTILAFLTASLIAFGFRKNNLSAGKNPGRVTTKKVARCGPDWKEVDKLIEENNIPPIPGAGPHTWKIITAHDSANYYFNQGMNMYYSFHIIEAKASFKKAEQFDPNAAMVHWAQALAYGPNINDVGYAAFPEALEAVRKSLEAMNNSTPAVEKMLIEAMSVRYSADSTQSRELLNQQYVDKMKIAYDRLFQHPHVAALYADALMLQHPWDLWNIDGTPKPWTPKIRGILEKLLASHPEHPGANHYYIHVMEPSPFASKALPSADRLGKITPALSHTVHMPSHIYLRTGQYDKGVIVNENAVNSYRKMISLYAPVTSNDFLYIIHNLHMQTNNAMMAGRAAAALDAAEQTTKSIPREYLSTTDALGNYLQYIYMTPVMAMVRFGKWDELLNAPKPPETMIYANLLFHFGKGMALNAKGQHADAKNELTRIQQLMKDSVLRLPFTPFSPAIDGATVAEQMLTGVIALSEKSNASALIAFQKAVDVEKQMVYNEPRDWMLNPGHWLGKAYLVAGKWKEAEKVFVQDLKNNNENPWALKGLLQALQGQSKKEAAAVKVRLTKASKRSDVNITHAAY
jgi:tetratricopeptide (TPR) repeat protein